MPIPLINRKTTQQETEKVYGQQALEKSLSHPLLKTISQNPFIQRSVSELCGMYYKSPISQPKVHDFIEEFNIQMQDFKEPDGGFTSFNDFFIRELADGSRPFPTDDNILGAPAEGRLCVYPIENSDVQLNVKSKQMSLVDLLQSDELAEQFVGGHVFSFRLAPVDYHRFHFPDHGHCNPTTHIPGALYSVNPIAHQYIDDIYLKNERHITELFTHNFAKMLCVEVGAYNVGTIKQCFLDDEKFARGDLKGYFEFGGSALLLITDSDVIPDKDLLENTQKGFETLIQLGENIARAR